jgi:Transposase
MLEGHWDGILAYFEDRRTSGPVEGINNKVRVVMRRGYGIRNLPTLWSRLVLDVNWACRKVGHTIAAIRQLAGRIQTVFAGVYT